MIVKNESAIIERCLSSIKDQIDYWVIYDTGSTDDTCQKIQEFMKNVPGELHQCDWVNFEYNRNLALERAKNKADYILMLDADDTLEFSMEFDKGALECDGYFLLCRDPIVDSYRLLMIKDHPDWKWIGILHEELDFPNPIRSGILKGVIKNGLNRDGHRAEDPKRYLQDASILEEELKKDPENSRIVFYLAQSYATAYETEKAIQLYEKRAKMGGYHDEVFWSLFFSACLKENINRSFQEVIESYCSAYQFDHNRAEPLCFLSRYLLKNHQYAAAYIVGKKAISFPRPQNLHYVQRDVYDYLAMLYFAYSQHLLKRFEEACDSYQKLLSINDLPNDVREMVGKFCHRSEKKIPIRLFED